MLDFTELPDDGTLFELLVRELLFSQGYSVRWSGAGADGGRDLLVAEAGDPRFGGKSRHWLVSCKHSGHSGRGIGVGGLGEIRDTCAQHGAGGYLLACTTHLTSAGVERLEKVGAGGDPHTHYWDGPMIERMLSTPREWPVAQRFMPVSAGDVRVWATEAPNVFIAACSGHRVQIAHRHSSTEDLTLDAIQERIGRFAQVRLPPEHELRMRAVWNDDKHGSIVWYADYLVPFGTSPALDRLELLERLGDGRSGIDGQFDGWDVELREVNRGSDGFHRDHYQFYDPYAETFKVGGPRRGWGKRDAW